MLVIGAGAAPERLVVEFVRHWLHLAGTGRLAQACALIDAPDPLGVPWTPESVIRVLHEVYWQCGEPPPRFTSPETSIGDGGARVYVLEDVTGYFVEHDVPLDDSYSDLTAQFLFQWQDGYLTVSLEDLHVL